MHEKWKKKLSKLQADMTKVKTQMDEVNSKNAHLREKLSNSSSYRDQVRFKKAFWLCHDKALTVVARVVGAF